MTAFSLGSALISAENDLYPPILTEMVRICWTATRRFLIIFLKISRIKQQVYFSGGSFFVLIRLLSIVFLWLGFYDLIKKNRVLTNAVMLEIVSAG